MNVYTFAIVVSFIFIIGTTHLINWGVRYASKENDDHLIGFMVFLCLIHIVVCSLLLHEMIEWGKHLQ